MRIAYIAHVNYSRESGVVKKVLTQTRLWRDLGHEARLFWLTRNPDLAELVDQGWGQGFLYKGGPFSPSRLVALEQLATGLFRWGSDVVYLRRDMYYPAYRKVAANMPLVVEINSDELAELHRYSKVQYLYHALTRGFLDRKLQGFVFVTQELMAASYFSRLPALKRVIANGADFEGLPHLKPIKNGRPVLVFLGQPAPWHGADKILRMAQVFPNWTFHLVGINGPAQPLPNVLTHGPLSYSGYLPILAKADIAIGTLALHRIGMHEASPLKVREYLALGLPVIAGYRDTDFPEGAPFLLSLPNREDNVDSSVERIRAFVEQWWGKRVPREEVAHLSTRAKETDRLDFFAGVLSRWRKT